MKFKCRLKVILAERDMKQQELAEQVGVSKSTMSAIVNGRQLPQFEVTYRIVKALGMRLEEIWVEADE